MDNDFDTIDWAHFERCRTAMGRSFIRLLSYFREDGVKAVAQLEAAMHEQDTVALVIPAHTLKEGARQFGATPLADLAEVVETTARYCVESHRFPDELVKEVVELRQRFDATVRLLDEAINPLLSRSPDAGSGRRSHA